MTELKLYNTLTRKKEVFEPIDEKNVRMYVCGPTVYDYAHIGNARPVIVFDVLFRLLKHLYPGAGTASDGTRVTYVRNITDVDDKINARALRDFGEDIAAGKLSLNDAIRNVTEKTASQFHTDVKALGCIKPTHEPRATEFVLPRKDGKADMATMIQTLLDKRHAYIAKGREGREVLFRVNSMVDNEGNLEYGKLSNRKLEDQQAGARIAVEDHKENPGDFVLWKESNENEPGWDGTFNGEVIHGRPGWHIECSAMSEALLWDDLKDRLSKKGLAHPHQFDIHGGGLDLIFPHHENEIAQSRCCHGTERMANYWMHNGYLQVEGRKMSKSEGNFVTIHSVLNEELPALIGLEHSGQDGLIRTEWNGLSARLSMLQTHYREPVDWTKQRMLEASNELYSWYEQLRGAHFNCEIESGAVSNIAASLADDLNTWDAITGLRAAYKNQDVRVLGEGMSLLGLLNKRFVQDDDILLFDRFAGIDDTETELRVNERLAFIKDKNWDEADRIRDELLAQGIQLMDSKDSQTGERITTWEVAR